MFSKGQHFFLGMMQGFCQQKAMLVFCLRANDDIFNLGILFVGDTYYIFKELLIETFRSRNVFHIIHLSYLTNDSIQRHIISLVWFAISIAKHKPSAIVLFQELGMKG